MYGRVNHAEAVFAANGLIEVTDAGRLYVVVQRDGALYGLEVAGCCGCLSLFLLCADFQLFDGVDPGHHKVDSFGQNTFDSTELQEDTPVACRDKDNCGAGRTNQDEEYGRDTHRNDEANR